MRILSTFWISLALNILIWQSASAIQAKQDARLDETKNNGCQSIFGKNTLGVILGNSKNLAFRNEIIPNCLDAGIEKMRVIFRKDVNRNIVLFDIDNYGLSKKIKSDQAALVCVDQDKKFDLEIVLELCANLPFNKKEFDGDFGFEHDIRGANNIIPFHTFLCNQRLLTEFICSAHQDLDEEYACDAFATASFVNAETKSKHLLVLLYYEGDRLKSDKNLRQILENRDVSIGTNMVFYVFTEPKPKSGTAKTKCEKYLNAFIADALKTSRKNNNEKRK